MLTVKPSLGEATHWREPMLCALSELSDSFYK